MAPKVTLESLVATVAEFAENEAELVATVLHLLQTGRVRLCAQAPYARAAFA